MQKNASLMCTLLGQCHEIFEIFLFHESKPSGPLINRIKWFCLKVRFHGEICEKFAAQANTVRSQTLRRLHCPESKIEMFANPKLAYTARSQTNFLFFFENINFQGI